MGLPCSGRGNVSGRSVGAWVPDNARADAVWIYPVLCIIGRGMLVLGYSQIVYYLPVNKAGLKVCR